MDSVTGSGLSPAGPLPDLRSLRGASPADFLGKAAHVLGLDVSEAGPAIAAIAAVRWLDDARARTLSVRSDLAVLPECRRRSCAIATDGERLFGLMAHPLDGAARTFLQSAALPHTLELALVSPATLAALLPEPGASEEDAPAPAAFATTASDDITELSLSDVDDGPITAVSLINRLFLSALKSEASDIHVEATPTGLMTRLRLDGLLDPSQPAHGKALAEQVLSRLKVLGSLDIAERRRPQDGRFRVKYEGRSIDVRLSVMPSIHGEDAVLRLLDKSSLVRTGEQLTLEALGFEPTALQSLRELAALPYGMLLVTGPTGSGKTTTLYAILSEINSGRDKIITIEDPVEYQVPGVLQVPVNEHKGLTFAVGLRSILRHDPDRIMVGEIRDTETAEIAVQAALTGHLVLTTVHANNVFDVIGRFAHMGIDPYTFVSALNGIWAQRLLRRTCTSCSEPVTPDDGLVGEHNGTGTWLRGRGCVHCRGTGYKGRLAVAESLVMDDEMRQRIVDRQPPAVLREAARRKGTVLLRAAAVAAAAAGLTTIEEVLRVTRADS